MQILYLIIAFLIGAVSGLYAGFKLVPRSILQYISENDPSESKIVHGKTEFIEPVTFQEKFDKAENVDDLIN